jgi:tetratricopeptide (TPR) repeat protein
VGGWYGYKEYIVKPKEDKAAEAMFKAQQYFSMDSSNLVLNGDGQSKGVLYVISNYGGTKAANLAHYYAGISYLKLGDFNKAVTHLKDFSTSAKQVQLMAYGALGDAYSELNKKDEAIDSYKKAASAFEKDENNSSEYLFRAALLSETAGKTTEALALYKEIKEKFPKTDKGFQADKYIYRLSTEKN